MQWFWKGDKVNGYSLDQIFFLHGFGDVKPHGSYKKNCVW